jgi:hypothetical protein
MASSAKTDFTCSIGPQAVSPRLRVVAVKPVNTALKALFFNAFTKFLLNILHSVPSAALADIALSY